MDGDTQGHVEQKIMTFYFVYPLAAISVPDITKYP